MDKIEYNSAVTVDFDSLPDASKAALVSRGVSHVFGNEAASKVHAWAQAEGQANSDDKATVKAWKDANASAVDAKLAEVQADFLKALIEGTLGSRTGGPRLSPLETVKRRIAREEISDMLRGAGIKVPTGDKTLTTADGTFTMDQLIDRRLAREDTGPAITKKAEKEIAAKAKQIAANAGVSKETVIAAL